MALGHIQSADEDMTAGRWHNDSLCDCYNDDALWGYNIRVADAVEQEKTQMGDSVLYRLFHLGTFDWKGQNVLGNQAHQAIRWACPTIFRVLQCVFRVEKQVRPSVHIPSE